MGYDDISINHQLNDELLQVHAFSEKHQTAINFMVGDKVLFNQ